MKKNFNNYKKIDKNICNQKKVNYLNYQENHILNRKFIKKFKNQLKLLN